MLTLYMCVCKKIVMLLHWGNWLLANCLKQTPLCSLFIVALKWHRTFLLFCVDMGVFVGNFVYNMSYNHFFKCYILLTVHPCVILQIKPTWCTIFLCMFYFYSLHVSGDCVPIIRRIYCINATSGTVTLCWWPSPSRLHGGMEHPTLHTRRSSTQSDNTRCRTDTVISPDNGHTVARNM
jgi:hypothetical protein